MPLSRTTDELRHHLDNPERYQSVDPSRMIDAIVGMPDQLRRASELAGQVDWKSFKPTTPAGICLCGMGGSAIGGDLVRSYWEQESPVPFIVVRNDHLPAMINRFWLVIASSYSGNTQEVLSAVREASRRGCRILAMTTGGALAELAQQQGWPCVTLPGGLSPRAALGYAFGPLMLTLAQWGIVHDTESELLATADLLQSRQPGFSPECPYEENAPKQIAAAIAGRLVCVYGTTGSTDIVALRIKGQFCENAKTAAFANTLPELLHNEIVGVDGIGGQMPLAALLLATDDDGAIPLARRMWLETRLKDRGVPVYTLSAVGGTRLQRMFSLIQFGDYLSYYTAILRGVDPTPIAAIDDLKAQMSGTDQERTQ